MTVTHPLPAADQLLDDFENDSLESGASQQRRRTVASYVAQVRKFLLHEEPRVTYASLENPGRCKSFFRMLKSRHLAPSTIQNYINAVKKFISWLGHRQLASSQVTSHLSYLLNNELMSLKKNVRSHRLAVLELKTNNMLTTSQIALFKDRAAIIMDTYLQVVEQNPTYAPGVRSLIGLIVAYFCTVAGLRRSCFQFMQVNDVLNAVQSDGLFVIKLSHDKTVTFYGHAQLAITTSEIAWLKRYIRVRPELNGYTAGLQLLFFTTAGTAVDKLSCHVRKAFHKVIGATGVTITSIRSAVATVVSRRLDFQSQRTAAHCMGTSLQTIERFYAAARTPSESVTVRKALDSALLSHVTTREDFQAVPARPLER